MLDLFIKESQKSPLCPCKELGRKFNVYYQIKYKI